MFWLSYLLRGDYEKPYKPIYPTCIMSKGFSLDKGIEEIFNLAKRVKVPPVLVSIHGDPNCGKTYLGKKLFDVVWNRGLVACGGQTENKETYFQNGPNPDYVFIEDSIFTESAERNARKFIGKGLDIRVLIDNPLIREYEFSSSVQENIRKKHYDIFIQNYDSKIKLI